MARRAGGPVLPLLGQPPVERADAARNRRALLAAAEIILVSSGVDAMTMERVAARAGVGVGTVYRRFRDRATLVYALLDDSERRFQAAFLSGPPPLGPGAPPLVRIRAFLHAYADRLESHGDLHAVAENHKPSGRYDSAPYQTHRTHLLTLLSDAGLGADAAYLADALLAPLSAALFQHQRRDRGLRTDEIKTGLDHLLAGLTSPCPSAGPGCAAPAT